MLHGFFENKPQWTWSSDLSNYTVLWRCYYFVCETMSLSVFLSTPPKLTSDKCWLSNSNEKKRGRFDIAVIRQVTLVFRSPMLKGQISAKCQKLEMLCGPKYRGDSLKIHGTAWIDPPLVGLPVWLWEAQRQVFILEIWWNEEYSLYTLEQHHHLMSHARRR